jgi:hypothetical protein
LNRWHVLGRWLACIGVVLTMSGFPAQSQAPVAAAQQGACATSAPESGAYSIRFCIATPFEGDSLSGDVTVAATVETEGEAPDIKFIQFYFTQVGRESSAVVLRDFLAPFTFTLPTDRWVDLPYRLEMNVMMIDRFESEKLGITVTTTNGVSRLPISTGRWVPKNVIGDQPIVIGAVGDGAGGQPASYDVAALIDGWNPQMFLYLGDVYNAGSYTEFINYYDPTFGRMKDITNPVPGDHEGGRQFQGYRDYWDSNEPYYSVTAGSWRLYGLNDTERYDQTSEGSIQFEWLQRQLEANELNACSIVYMHSPRWGRSPNGNNDYLDELWRLLAAEGVDIVITGHEHNYQRWTPMDANGNPSPTGVTQFVVGTGGHELINYSRTDPRLIATEQGLAGALKLELREGEAEYTYIDTDGTVLDSGTTPCHDAPDEALEEEPPLPVATGTVVNTNGRGVFCRTAANSDAEIIALLPEGTTVQLRGAPDGAWQPVRCGDQDGYVAVAYIQPDG